MISSSDRIILRCDASFILFASSMISLRPRIQDSGTLESVFLSSSGETMQKTPYRSSRPKCVWYATRQLFSPQPISMLSTLVSLATVYSCVCRRSVAILASSLAPSLLSIACCAIQVTASSVIFMCTPSVL